MQTDNFLGEIRLFGGNYAPEGWVFCDGRLLSIFQNEALYALVGTTYGGDGMTTFAVPDLRGRVPISQGAGPGLTSRIMGESAGAEEVTLGLVNLPSHAHSVAASTDAATTRSAGPTVVLAEAKDKIAGQTDARYLPASKSVSSSVTLSANQVSSTGGSQAHPNVMPSIAVNYIMAVTGIFPSGF